jgi:hypothetical protein
VEKLVVEAMRVGATLQDVLSAVADQWRALQPLKAVSHDD